MIGKVILKDNQHPEGKYKRVTLTDEEIFKINFDLANENKDLMKQCLLLAEKITDEKEIRYIFNRMGDSVGAAKMVDIGIAMFNKLAPKVFTALISALEQKIFNLKNGIGDSE